MGHFSRRDFLRTLGIGAGSLTISRLLAACNLSQPVRPALPASAATLSVPAAPPGTSLPAGAADAIYTNGTVLTMDAGRTIAEAIAISGEKILSVGPASAVLQLSGPNSAIIDLRGRTLMPGFIDAHSHIIFSAPTKEDFLQLQQLALSGGVTTTTEMTVTPDLLDRLTAYEYRGCIRLLYNTYFGYNDVCGESPNSTWYRSHPPRQDISAHIRNQGVKVFSDGGACNAPAVSFEYPGGYGHGDLYYTQDEMNQIVAQIHADGYQVAVHALGDR